MNIMTNHFPTFFCNRLKQIGYEIYENNESFAHIYKGKKYICSFEKDLSLKFHKDNTIVLEIVRKLSAIRDRLSIPYKLYDKSEVFKACSQENVRKLTEYDNCVLAAQLMENSELNFVTWEYTYNRTAVTLGHYFGTAYEAAQEDFVIRSGLIGRGNVLSKEQAKMINTACVYRYEHDDDLALDDRQTLQKIIEQLNKNESKTEKLIITDYNNE